jgi:hypothetical protein
MLRHAADDEGRKSKRAACQAFAVRTRPARTHRSGKEHIMKSIACLLSFVVLALGVQGAWAVTDMSAPRSVYEASELAGQPPFPSRGGLIGD